VDIARPVCHLQELKLYFLPDFKLFFDLPRLLYLFSWRGWGIVPCLAVLAAWQEMHPTVKGVLTVVVTGVLRVMHTGKPLDACQARWAKLVQ
jgi:hypothetical protein